jgi:hypothetical protein
MIFVYYCKKKKSFSQGNLRQANETSLSVFQEDQNLRLLAKWAALLDKTGGDHK